VFLWFFFCANPSRRPRTGHPHRFVSYPQSRWTSDIFLLFFTFLTVLTRRTVTRHPPVPSGFGTPPLPLDLKPSSIAGWSFPPLSNDYFFWSPYFPIPPPPTPVCISRSFLSFPPPSPSTQPPDGMLAMPFSLLSPHLWPVHGAFSGLHSWYTHAIKCFF